MDHQTDNQVHIDTLHKLLNQVGRLNVDNDSREKLTEALQAALRAMRSQDQGGVELSQDASTDALLRLIEGRPTAKAETNHDAVMHLAALVNNEAHTEDQGDAVNFLASLVKD